MPKLNYPKITKGDAIFTLLKLYGQEPDFMKEWTAILEPYVPLLSKFAGDSFTFFNDSGISPAESWQANIDYMKGKTKKDPFPADKFEYMAESLPYFNSLSELAYKWKLRAPWAIGILFILDLIEVSGTQEFLGKIDIPLEKLALIYPWEPPLPTLEISVPAWALFVVGRKAIQAEINKRLKEYEKQLKAKGLREYPSSIDKHAKWWFKHHVKGKTYKEIDEESQEAYEETIRKEVPKFSKLIGIKIS